MGDYLNVHFTYTTKDGKEMQDSLKIQKGLEIPTIENGYDTNVYRVGNDGKVRQRYNPDGKYWKPVSSINVTEDYMNELRRLSKLVEDGGLSKEDYKKYAAYKANQAVNKSFKEKDRSFWKPFTWRIFK